MMLKGFLHDLHVLAPARNPTHRKEGIAQPSGDQNPLMAGMKTLKLLPSAFERGLFRS
jgi:hypothetical protein